MSKHLRVLKHAGLVNERRAGRQTHYRAEPAALAPLMDWTSQMAEFWQSRFDRLEQLLQRMDPMNEHPTPTLSVVVEREFPHPPDKISAGPYRAGLIAGWLMQNDFAPVTDHRFKLRADWGEVDCTVTEIEPFKMLAYTWVAYGLESVVRWTLAPSGAGTLVRMEQSGFQPEQTQAYNGAKAGWQHFFSGLETVVARIAA